METEISSDIAKDELEAPIVLTLDQIAAVAAGTATTATPAKTGTGATTGFWDPRPSKGTVTTSDT